MDKTALRAELRRLRRAQTPDVVLTLPLDRLPPYSIFSLYQPMGAEMDPRPLAGVLRGQACLPVALDRDAPLEFRAWTPGDALAPDAFGIMAPTPDAPLVEPDLVIAPVLGFDAAGNRLGQGAGHYDRTLTALRARKRVFVVGLAYAAQEVPALPAEPHDQKLDAILTETGFRAFV